MTLTDSLRTSLNNWDDTLPTEKKKLLRTAIRAAFVRGDTLVALQPTEVFWPLTEPIRCQSGEGGRGDNRYNCEKIIFPISIEEILLQLEHKFSNVFVEPASEA
jgi:hypothetical protein